MQRAMIVLNGSGPRDTSFQYDHPYFGQLFLATIFRIIDYPNSLDHSPAGIDLHSIEMLFSIPRILMGILAVVDTFLVYKISERLYNRNRNVAFIASVLFAVMPMTWLLRRILLDSILLPFLLSSILFALYAKGSRSNSSTNSSRRNVMVLLSGIFLGLAIFTKIPVFTMIPLVGFLVYTSTHHRNLRMLGIWFIPVILIPLIWPAHALYIGETQKWLNGIYYETHRNAVNESLQSVTGIGSIFDSMRVLLRIDPILTCAGLVGIFVFAAIKRDLVLLLWAIPLLIFLYFVGFVQYFYLIPLIPAFCIVVAKLMNDLSMKVNKKNLQQKITTYFDTYIHSQQKSSFLRILDHLRNLFGRFLPVAPIILVSGIGIFGLISMTMLITTNLNSSYFEAIAFVDKYLYDSNFSNSYKNNLTVISDFRYTWIPQYVTHENYYYKRFWDNSPIKTEKVLLVFQDDFVNPFLANRFDLGNENILGDALYNSTLRIAAFNASNTHVYDARRYPYTSLIVNAVPQRIEIRTNSLLSNSSAIVFHIDNNTLVDQFNHTLKTIIPTKQLKLPLFWIDPFKNCNYNFKCIVNLTGGWKDYYTSLQLSTNTTNKNTWSGILYNKQIDVNSGKQYQIVTHMKLNKYVIGSHVAIQGYNETSKSWYQIIQCPSGTNGSLEWTEFKCNITVPANTTQIRPVLNAGWSSQIGKEAVTLFDGIEINNTCLLKISNVNQTCRNLISNADFVYFDNTLTGSDYSARIITHPH